MSATSSAMRFLALAFAARACALTCNNGSRLALNMSSIDGVIEPALFGSNLEFTRHDIATGLSAQLVSNRFFSVPFDARWPPRWEALRGGRDPAVDYPGASGRAGTTALRCDVGSGETCGVVQAQSGAGWQSGLGNGSAIVLSAGRAYEGRIVVKASAATTVRVIVRASAESAPDFSATMRVAQTSNWTTLAFAFNATQTTLNATLELAVTTEGAASLWFGAVSVLPSDHVDGLRADVVAALAALGMPGPLRYPGGCFASLAGDWRAQLSAADFRPPIELPPSFCAAVPGGVAAYTDGFASDGPNVDEYVRLCRAVGAEPAITLPLQFGNESELDAAVSLVEYCNGDALATRYGALRAARNGGDPTPYDVRKWSLGNELFQGRWPDDWALRDDPLGAGVAPPSPAEYAAMLSILVPRLLAVDPTLELIAGGGSTDAAWTNAWMAEVGEHVFAASDHDGYADRTVGGAEATAPDAQFVSALRELRATLDANGTSRVRIAADEWGLGPPWVERAFGTPHALYAASLLGAVVRSARALGIGATNYFESINEGALRVEPFGVARTPLGEVLRLYARHASRARVVLDMPWDGCDSDTALDVVASEKNATVLVTLANRDANAACGVALDIAGALSVVNDTVVVDDGTLLRANGTDASSTFASEGLSSLPVDDEGRLMVFVPAFSVLDFTVSLGALLSVGDRCLNATGNFGGARVVMSDGCDTSVTRWRLARDGGVWLGDLCVAAQRCEEGGVVELGARERCLRLDGGYLRSPTCALCADPEGELADVSMAPCGDAGTGPFAAVYE